MSVFVDLNTALNTITKIGRQSEFGRFTLPIHSMSMKRNEDYLVGTLPTPPELLTFDSDGRYSPCSPDTPRYSPETPQQQRRHLQTTINDLITRLSEAQTSLAELTEDSDAKPLKKARVTSDTSGAGAGAGAGAGLKMSLEKSLLWKSQLSVIPHIMDAYQLTREVERGRNKELVTFFEECILTNHPRKKLDDFDLEDESNCTDDGVYKYCFPLPVSRTNKDGNYQFM